MNYTLYESIKWRFYTLVYTSKTFRFTKKAVQEAVYLVGASATNALEACTTTRLLPDIGGTSTSTTCPEGNVRLHELCKACTLFTQRSVAPSWLDGSNPRSDWPSREDYRLCTVGHLRRLNGLCHFCTALYFFVSRLLSSERVANFDKSWLYLCFVPYHKPWEHDSVQLVARLYPQGLHIKSFDLRLLADHGAGDHVDALVRATHIPLRSNDNTGCVRNWLESCLKGHTTCRAAGNEPTALRTRPERMLAIDGDGVKLICNWPGTSDSKYLALSHMWGTDCRQQLRLVFSRLDEFQEDVPWTELPLIFKEAIRIARQIGYSYIWIDSLCIIQDSASDWANEAGKMAHVYGHADCTIAYLLPPEDMFTKPRQDPRIWSPCIFRRSSLASRGVYIRPTIDHEMVSTYTSAIDDSHIDWLSPKDWPLFTRAWACQEYLLSPRILFAGHRHLVWECSELLGDELLGPINTFFSATARKTHFSAVRSVTLPVKTIAAQLEFVQNWGRLVLHYRAGALTQPKDRVMAFAGIAQAVHNSSGLTYLAGSWAQMFPFSFMWGITITSRNNMMTEVEAVIEAAPSWSWFSIPIFSHNAFGFRVVDNILRLLRSMEDKRIESMCQATLLSSENRSQQACADSSPTKPFYNFIGMTLNLAMKTWTGFLEDYTNYDLRYERSIQDQFRTLLGTYHGRLHCQFDHHDTGRNHFNKNMAFGLLIELRTGREPGTILNYQEPFLVGLIMQPKPGREVYKRIGLWTLYLRGYPPGWDAKKFESVSIFDQLEGVRSEHIRLV